MRNRLIVIVIITFRLSVFSQPTNDECSRATPIVDARDWCSGNRLLSNIEATPSGFGAATCFDNTGKDVWYSFTALATGVNITLNGEDNGNNLLRPQIALYEGSCNGTISELACGSSNNRPYVVSIAENGLTIGRTYLIRVSARGDGEGNFEICTQNFNPPIQPGQDCNTGAILCDKSSFVVEVLEGGGLNNNEGRGSCLEGGNPFTITEDQSTWLKWTAATNGSITFTITPIRAKDDIDFAFYELSDLSNCGSRTLLRCVATSCSGPTGLNLTSNDLTEDFNCESDEDGFVRFVDMEAGKSYGILINNFSNSGTGFKIDFGGDGNFEGPRAEFTVTPSSGLRCDQDFVITDQSTNTVGQITRYDWNFGERALPMTSSTMGPHTINYESFGEKFIVLTIESDLGCIVTEILPITAEPCCDDIDMLDINILDMTDPLCSGEANGSIRVEGQGTNGEYVYAINDSEFQTQTLFDNLSEGSYEVKVQDIKGCVDSIILNLSEPNPIIVDAGMDQEIDLGDSTMLNGSYISDRQATSIWSPVSGIDNVNILDPTVFPFGTTTYILTVTDEEGCNGSDAVVIRTNADRNIIAPNVFSPYTSPGQNDRFFIFGNKGIEKVQDFLIFDRWGNKMFENKNIPIGEESFGWDGLFNGKELNPGIYVWMANIRFLDGEVLPYAGDVMIVK